MTDAAQLIEQARAAVERVRELTEPAPAPLPIDEVRAQLIERARATVERTRELIEAIRAAQMQAASLRAEKAMEREEAHFRRLARCKVDLFP